MKALMRLLIFTVILGLNCSDSVVYYKDVCEGIALNQFENLENRLKNFVDELEKADGDEENFTKIESFLNNFNCVDQVKIFKGIIKTEPEQKEFRIDFNTGVAKIIDVYILENNYAYYRMHD